MAQSPRKVRIPYFTSSVANRPAIEKYGMSRSYIAKSRGVYVEASGKYEASSAETILCRPLSGCDITAKSNLNRIGRSRYCGQRNGKLIVNRTYCVLWLTLPGYTVFSHQEQGTRSQPHHSLSDTAEQHSADTTSTVRANHQKVSFPVLHEVSNSVCNMGAAGKNLGRQHFRFDAVISGHFKRALTCLSR
jgi:hypothetical protein